MTEVIEEYPTDSTETILVTFTSASPDNCYPNLVQWGIDMADPMESDTPQGQSYWLARAPHYTLDAANMPSPSHFATNFYTPPYSLIEIDPPARSVEFHYSRRLQAPARWPCTGCAYVFADSMQVRAMQRIPGTISYFIYDRKVLYSNLTTTDGPFNVWTHVKLNGGGGDNIQWVWFDGHLALDDLKITRVLVTCTPRPRRGEEVVCRVTSPNLNVTRWEFQPDSAALPPVQDTTTSKEWRGVVAIPGQAIAYTTDENGIPRILRARFDVVDRPSVWPSVQTYRVGPELTAPDAEPGLGVVLGRNCPEVRGTALCIETRRVQPDPVQQPDSGFTARQIASGPNRGYWYVATARYDMRRVGNVNPGALAGSPRTHPLPATIPKACRQNLGFGPHANPVIANFNRYNNACQGINMTAFVDAVLGHEGLGYNGGQGHESIARAAAAEPQNDPFAAIERLVRADSAGLALEANRRVTDIANDITQRARDQLGPTGCPTSPVGNRAAGPIWFWDAGPSLYVQYTICGF